MESRAEFSLVAGSLPDLGPPAPPFERQGMLLRVAPFAVVAVLAEASLALPPGPVSGWAVAVSAGLLLAVAAAFFLPWPRLPDWLRVVVPLAYTGSVLALILAAGPTSGVGIVILIPLIWTALFHRRWESAVIVAAIVAVEVITSLAPVAASGTVIARRVLLWGSLGALVSVATHGLRDRIRASHEETARLQGRLRELTVAEDRDRIAADLQDKVIQRIFAAGLTLQGAATLTTEPEVRRRVEASVDDLDQVLRTLRDTIFGLERRLKGRGLRQDVLGLCGLLSPAPEVSFSGPVDGALHPGARVLVLELLREALGLIGGHSASTRVAVTAGGDSCLTVIEAVLRPGTTEAGGNGSALELSRLRDSARKAGIRIDIETIPDGTRFAWHVPLSLPVRAGPAGLPE